MATHLKRPLRIAIAGFKLESVTFLPNLTTLADFQAVEVRGNDLIERHRGANTPIGGFVAVCESNAVEMFPIIYSEAGAAACSSEEAFDYYLNAILEGLNIEHLDGILLDLHGALVTPQRLDGDGDIIAAVRQKVGHQVQIMVALDYHANLDQTTIAQANAVFGYHFSPHTDQAQTGERTANCLLRTLRGDIHPVMHLCKPGLMVPSIFSATDLEPLATVVRNSIQRAEDSTEYLDISIFAGFSYADVPNCGFSVLAVANKNPQLAQSSAEEFCSILKQAKAAFSHRELVYSMHEGLAEAQRQVAFTNKPIVLLEHADRMVDSTHVLKEVVRLQLGRTAVPFLWDAAAVAQVIQAGVGAQVTVSVGGHSSDRAGDPVSITGKIIFAGPKAFRATGPYYTGRWIDLGDVVVIDTGYMVLSLTTRPSVAVSEDCFIQFDMSINDFNYVLLRSKTHFRASYTDITGAIIIIDTPDWGPADLLTLDYKHVPREQTYPFSET
jgi:microcystin degradation protein MlrC